MDILVATVYYDLDSRDSVIYSGTTLDEIVPQIKEIGKSKLAEPSKINTAASSFSN